MDEIEIVCWFSGRVQGVGFRWRTLQTLTGHAIRGYVRNLADGRVELRLQGSRAHVDAAVQAVTENLSGYIATVERAEHRIEKRLGAFRIER